MITLYFVVASVAAVSIDDSAPVVEGALIIGIPSLLGFIGCVAGYRIVFGKIKSRYPTDTHKG